MREKLRNLSPLSIEWKNIVPDESRAMRAGKPHFTVTEGEVLTIAMKLSIGMRDNFGIVLSVKCCGAVSVVARCQGRPHASLLWSLGYKKQIKDETTNNTCCNIVGIDFCWDSSSCN